jgi:phosphoglycolate phosphatase-like HAD superfamily hydrolase
MQTIEAILFEPVGCLAEFAPEEFDAIAERVFGCPPGSGRSGSEAYWDVLKLMDAGGGRLTARERSMVEDYEIQAVDRVRAYEDVAPALLELKDLGITSIVASSMSAAAVTRFLENFSLANSFAEVWSRDAAGGVKNAPLMKAVTSRSLKPDRVMFITDTAEGLQTAKHVGVNAILMMNDPDEAMKLTAHEPAGGIVSLHELPDFVRLVAAENATSEPGTGPRLPGRASRSASQRL